MKTLLLTLVLFSSSVMAGEWYAEIGVGITHGNDWQNEDDLGAYLALRYETKYRKYKRLSSVFHITHLSNWNVGPPSDNDRESYINHIGWALRIKL